MRLSTQPIWIRTGGHYGCDECRRPIEAGAQAIIYSGNTNFFCSESCYQGHWAREWALRNAIAQVAL